MFLSWLQALSEDKKAETNLYCVNAAKKYAAAYEVKEIDLKSSLILLLTSMEEFCECIARLLYEIVPNSYKFSHEAKLTPYYLNSPRDNDDEIWLALDISGKRINRRKIKTVEEFLKIEKSLSWNSHAERYGVMFRHGRNFRGNEWEQFLCDEVPRIGTLVQYLGKFSGYLQKRVDNPDGMPFWKFTENSVIVMFPLKELDNWLEEYNKNRNRTVDNGINEKLNSV